MSRILNLGLALGMLAIVGCTHKPIFVAAEAIPTPHTPVSPNEVEFEPHRSNRKFEELGVFIALVSTTRELRRELIRAGARVGADAIIDVEICGMFPSAYINYVPIRFTKIYGATPVRWTEPDGR